jgi:hypothetical protein
VQEARGVLFEVDALHSNASRYTVDLDIDVAVDAKGLVVLGDLIALHEVRIWVVLAVELSPSRYLAVQGESRHDRKLNSLPVYYGQDAGHAAANGANVGVGLGAAVVSAATAVHLRSRQQLGVRFQTNDNFVLISDGGHIKGAVSIPPAPVR